MFVGVSPDGDWEWGGCADNVKYGYKKSREFMDAKYRKRSDLKTQVMLHNNEAGRLVCAHTFSQLKKKQFLRINQGIFLSFWTNSSMAKTNNQMGYEKAVKNFMRTECKCVRIASYTIFNNNLLILFNM